MRLSKFVQTFKNKTNKGKYIYMCVCVRVCVCVRACV